MQYGFVLPGGEIRDFGEYAVAAERAGWDAIFIPDALSIETKNYPAFDWFDPWVVLAVMAERTERIKLGTMLTALPRRRPWKLAREVSTLDHLSNGRMILASGVGAAEDDGGFYKVGEAMDLKVRAEMMGEGLEIIDGLWRGKPYSFSGEHYKVEKMTMLPKPLQKPRVPLWVVGVWPKSKSVNRALRWDGLIVQTYREDKRTMPVTTPDDIRNIKQYVEKHRKKKTPFEIITGVPTPGKNRKKAAAMVQPFLQAGATWWLDALWSAKDKQVVLTRIKQGPPRLD
jgi:alkanesulfonate monooxygenase SsuD/methylene tetrahydromethanopterin reductase-like flavin-dependent oxidoreductase (luciferase family)